MRESISANSLLVCFPFLVLGSLSFRDIVSIDQSYQNRTERKYNPNTYLPRDHARRTSFQYRTGRDHRS
jgi:hypothetical protein